MQVLLIMVEDVVPRFHIISGMKQKTFYRRAGYFRQKRPSAMDLLRHMSIAMGRKFSFDVPLVCRWFSSAVTVAQQDAVDAKMYSCLLNLKPRGEAGGPLGHAGHHTKINFECG